MTSRLLYKKPEHLAKRVAEIVADVNQAAVVVAVVAVIAADATVVPVPHPTQAALLRTPTVTSRSATASPRAALATRLKRLPKRTQVRPSSH